MTSHRDKRGGTLMVLKIMASIAALAGISYGVIATHVTAKNLTKVEGTSDQVSLSIKDMKRYLSSFARMVMDHHLALAFLLAK
jgi:hypothetical protein